VLNKTLTIDEAAEALQGLMQKDFNREWLARLSRVSRLDIVRAEDELIFLDFFAIYFSLKFTRSPGWRDKGVLVFEKFFSSFLSWYGNFLESKRAGTRDDAFKILDARLNAYGASIEEPSSAEPEEMLRSIGLKFAMYALAEECEKAFLVKLLVDCENIITTVGAEVFNHRVQMLHTWFDSHKIA